jgi:hypothetical protein
MNEERGAKDRVAVLASASAMMSTNTFKAWTREKIAKAGFHLVAESAHF